MSNNIKIEINEETLDNNPSINISDFLLDNEKQNSIEHSNKKSKYSIIYDYNYFNINYPEEDEDEDVNYSKNTKPELMRICEYYKIECSKMKLKKDQIIQLINTFENNVNNEATVSYRKELWYYIDILRNDEILKKYIVILPPK